MKTSSTWIIGSTVGKIVMGLVLTAMIGSVSVVPALGEDNHKHDKGRYEHKERGHEHDRGRAHYQTYHPYGYYYVPPPVVYAPPPQPGISIFLPIR